MQLTDAPKMSIYYSRDQRADNLLKISAMECLYTVKKKATLAIDACFSIDVPLKLSRMEINIIDTPRPKLPSIMGRRRPMRSTSREGTKDPSRNMIWMLKIFILALLTGKNIFWIYISHVHPTKQQRQIPRQSDILLQHCGDEIPVYHRSV